MITFGALGLVEAREAVVPAGEAGDVIQVEASDAVGAVECRCTAVALSRTGQALVDGRLDVIGV